MRIPQDKSNKEAIVIIACVALVVGLFFCLQKYENARFHKEVSPKMFSQNSAKTSATRGIASE
jgi:hypothetical protein